MTKQSSSSTGAKGAKGTISPKNMNEIVDGERYRTDLSYLLASNEAEGKFLYRSISSLYFLQTHGSKDTLQPLSIEDAEVIYDQMPAKHQSLIASFPKKHGGVGMDTPTKYD